MAIPASEYPVSLEIDYEERHERLSTLLRLFLVIPVAIVLGLLFPDIGRDEAEAGWQMCRWGVGFTVVPLVLTLLFAHRYPRWWYDWNYQLMAFSARVWSYFWLLRDEYPSLEDEQAVHLRMPYPDLASLSRGLPLIKWLLVLPHVIVLLFLNLFILPVAFLAWISILFTGKHPRALFDYVLGVMRWDLRVLAYSLLMTTDEYPPFSLFR